MIGILESKPKISLYTWYALMLLIFPGCGIGSAVPSALGRGSICSVVGVSDDMIVWLPGLVKSRQILPRVRFHRQVTRELTVSQQRQKKGLVRSGALNLLGVVCVTYIYFACLLPRPQSIVNLSTSFMIF